MQMLKYIDVSKTWHTANLIFHCRTITTERDRQFVYGLNIP